MKEQEAIEILRNKLKFTDNNLNDLVIFRNLLLEYNANYNLISKSTEDSIWCRHILDSAQLIKYFDFNTSSVLADFGSGAGFPGIVLSIFNKNPKFHVKLYEKSPIKREFLNNIREKIKIKVEIIENIYENEIDADIIVLRAFKKLGQIIKISREIVENHTK